jgi:hypothetical protein
LKRRKRNIKKNIPKPASISASSHRAAMLQSFASRMYFGCDRLTSRGSGFMNQSADLETHVNVVRFDDAGDDKFVAIAKDIAQRITATGKDQHADTD